MFQPEYLAQNIRKHRILHGLTQAELAAELFVTAQNISKWETGKSVPDLENLYMLSHILRVSTDRLLGRTDALPQGRVMVAIAGDDGTNTEFVLFTEYGEILERLCLPGSSPNSVGLDTARAVIKNGIDQLMIVSGDICAINAGIATCGNVNNQNAIHHYLRKLYPGIPCQVGSDALNVIYSTSVQERCITAICDTGSVVYAKTPTQLERIGGWGPLWESGWSNYDFGRDAILAALQARDSLSEPTLLQDLVEQALGGNVWDNINEIYNLPRESISNYAQLIFDAYKHGDAVAAQIVEKNTQQLARLINAAARNYDCGPDVILSGELLSHKDILMRHLQPKLQPGLKLHTNTLPPIYGAAIRCCALLGIDTAAFKEAFHQNYLRITL